MFGSCCPLNSVDQDLTGGLEIVYVSRYDNVFADKTFYVCWLSRCFLAIGLVVKKRIVVTTRNATICSGSDPLKKAMIIATRAPPHAQMVVSPSDMISAMRHTANMISQVAISQFI